MGDTVHTPPFTPRCASAAADAAMSAAPLRRAMTVLTSAVTRTPDADAMMRRRDAAAATRAERLRASFRRYEAERHAAAIFAAADERR